MADRAAAAGTTTPNADLFCIINGQFVICPTTTTTPIPASSVPPTTAVTPTTAAPAQPSTTLPRPAVRPVAPSTTVTVPATTTPATTTPATTTPPTTAPAPTTVPRPSKVVPKTVPAPATTVPPVVVTTGSKTGNWYWFGLAGLLLIGLVYTAYRYRRVSGAAQKSDVAAEPNVAVVVAVLASNGAVWYRVRTSGLDLGDQFVRWRPADGAPGTEVSVAVGSAQFVLAGLAVGEWDTLPELRAHQVDYVVLSVRLFDQDNATNPAYLDLVKRQGRLLYSSQEPTAVQVYDVRTLTGVP